MTSPASAAPSNDPGHAALHPRQASRASAAFTLVELLVVIFIIALLTLLILGGVHRSRRTAAISKTRADIAAISSALEQYRSDHKNYPGLPEVVGGPKTRSILAAALIGPGPEAEDGANGSGFRTTNPATGAVDMNSKVWPAYLSPEKFQVKRFPPDPATPGVWAILDAWGHPIRYYPKRRNFNPKLGPLVSPATVPPDAPEQVGMFNNLDGAHPFGYDASGTDTSRDISDLTLRVLLGDTSNGNNMIDNDESFRCDAGFILASSGPDEVFPLINTGESQTDRSRKLTKTSAILNFDFR
jgi:type II secretory pathway pseudopilin PulG